MIQREAEKIAKKAAHALRQSRTNFRSTPVNAPTWTGRSGSAGAPRFGASSSSSKLSSSNILAHIRSRNAEAISEASASPEVAKGQHMAEKISAFLRARGGSASSASLASSFREDADGDDPELFRSILKQVAILQRQVGGKVWRLRPEFR